MSIKAQVKFVEIFGVLAVFMFLVIIGIAFFSQISLHDAQQAENRRADILTLRAANAVSGLTEIQCTVEGRANTVCVDKYKYCALRALMLEDTQFRLRYSSIFGTDTHIQLQVFDNAGEPMYRSLCTETADEPETLYGRLIAGTFAPIADSDEVSRPIIKPVYVLDPITESQNFALIEVYTLQ